VEEQFYLTLPFMTKYVRPRRLPYLVGIVILLAPVFRTLLRLFVTHGEVGTYVLMPSRADALMLGVLAAFFLRTENGLKALVAGKKLLYAAQGIFLCGMVWMSLEPGALSDSQLAEILPITNPDAARSITIWQTFKSYAGTALSSLNYTWIALFYLCMLLIGITQRQSMLAGALRNPALISIGGIAYGAYLFHEPVLGLCYAITTRGTLPVIIDFTTLAITSCALVLTVGLAKLSWVYLEKPLIGLGHKYRYVSSQQIRSKRRAA
jgi:peptidoglycan/LPS O-acetylase OafA/YrhL